MTTSKQTPLKNCVVLSRVHGNQVMSTLVPEWACKDGLGAALKFENYAPPPGRPAAPGSKVIELLCILL